MRRSMCVEPPEGRDAEGGDEGPGVAALTNAAHVVGDQADLEEGAAEEEGEYQECSCMGPVHTH